MNLIKIMCINFLYQNNTQINNLLSYSILFHYMFLQLDYYTLKNPSHWITINDVNSETYIIRNLEPRTTVTVLVRAKNEHGLSPPSPVSKPLSTLPPSLSYKQSTAHSSEIDVTNSFVVRQRLSQRVIEIIEAVVIGPRKVKLRWEVRMPTTLDLITSGVLPLFVQIRAYRIEI